MTIEYLLLQQIGVGGFMCPMFLKASRNRINSYVFRKSAPNSASVENAVTWFKILHKGYTASSKKINLLS